MVGGVGYAAGRAGARREQREAYQDQRLAELEQQGPPSPPAATPPPSAAAPASGESTVQQLQSLAQLRDSGVLTNEEFEQQKRKILAGG